MPFLNPFRVMQQAKHAAWKHVKETRAHIDELKTWGVEDPERDLPHLRLDHYYYPRRYTALNAAETRRLHELNRLFDTDIKKFFKNRRLEAEYSDLLERDEATRKAR
jgi:hypothetical protein